MQKYAFFMTSRSWRNKWKPSHIDSDIITYLTAMVIRHQSADHMTSLVTEFIRHLWSPIGTTGTGKIIYDNGMHATLKLLRYIVMAENSSQPNLFLHLFGIATAGPLVMWTLSRIYILDFTALVWVNIQYISKYPHDFVAVNTVRST